MRFRTLGRPKKYPKVRKMSESDYEWGSVIFLQLFCPQPPWNLKLDFRASTGDLPRPASSRCFFYFFFFLKSNDCMRHNAWIEIYLGVEAIYPGVEVNSLSMGDQSWNWKWSRTGRTCSRRCFALVSDIIFTNTGPGGVIYFCPGPVSREGPKNIFGPYFS